MQRLIRPLRRSCSWSRIRIATPESCGPRCQTHGPRPSARLLIGLGLALLFLTAPRVSFAQLPAARLDWLQPSGGAPGSSFELTVGGADLEEASELIFSHPGITATLKHSEATPEAPAQPIYGTFVVSVAADVSQGIYEARVRGRFGISNSRRFAIDALETLIDNGNNRQVDLAQAVSIGQVIDGRIEANSRDYYRFELAQGEQVLLQAATASLDSRATAVLEILDIEGRTLTRFRAARGEDTQGIFVAPFAGPYVVAIYDLVYGGSNDYFYRLRLHRGPLIESFSPGIIPANTSAEVTVIGSGLAGSAAPLSDGSPWSSLALPIDSAALGNPVMASLGRSLLPLSALDDLSALPLSVPGADATSKLVPILISDLPIIAEVESDDEWNSLASAMPIAIPCIVDGRFGEARDRDWFEFSAKQGERWVIEVFSDRLGMPTDPLFAIHKVNTKEDGSIELQQLSVVDDTPERTALIGTDFDTTSDDPATTFDVPADGTYRIALDDQFGGNRADPAVRYALRIRPLSPRVRLLVEPPLGRPGNDQQAIIGTFEVRRGGTEKINVRIHRLEGADVPVTLRIEGLPAGLSCEPVTVSTVYGTTSLVITAAEDAAPWSGPIRVIGSYQLGDAAHETVALAGALAHGTENRQVRIASARLSQEVMLGVVTSELEPVAARPQTIRLVTSRGAKPSIPLSLVRRNFDAAVTLNPVGQHGEFKVAPVAFEAGANEGAIAFDLTSGNLPVGLHQFVLQGDVTFKYVRNPQLITAAEARQAEVQQQLEAAQAAKDAAAANVAQNATDETQAALTAAEAELTRVTELKAQVDKQLEETRNANQPADRVYTLMTPHIEVLVEASPLSIQATGIDLPVGQTGQVVVSLERRYGFEGPVTLSATSPAVAGLTLTGGEMPADQTQLPITIATTAETPAGQVVITIQATAKFNNLDVPTTLEIPINIVPAN